MWEHVVCDHCGLAAYWIDINGLLRRWNKYINVLSFSYKYNHSHIGQTWCCETFLLVGSLKEVLRSGGRKLLLIYEQLFHMLNVVFQPNKFHSQMFYLSHTNTTILTFICNCTRKMIITILTFGELDVVRLFSLLEVLKKSREVANESCCYFMSSYFICWMLCYNQQVSFSDVLSFSYKYNHPHICL